MKNSILRYGLIAGLIMLVTSWLNWFTVSQSMGYNASQFVGYLSIIIGLMTIPLGIKYFKEKVNGGKVSFGNAFKIGTGINTLAALFMFFHSAFFFLVQGDAFLEWYKNSMTPEEWEVAQAQMAQMGDDFMNPWFQGFVMLVTVFLIGLIITLIAALVLKKD